MTQDRQMIVNRLIAAGIGPREVAATRRRLGLDADQAAVLQALDDGRQPFLAQDEHPPPVVVSGVDMPTRLRDTWSLGGPLWVWHHGELAAEGPSVAVVGTRRPTADGLGLATAMGRDLAAAGVTVISGMARGIDQAAHRGALESGGRTLGVLGTGTDIDYPRGSESLRAAVAASGGLIAEYPPGHGIRQPSQFLARNRILVGLADAVVVIEAGVRSGALNSATWAAEFGRDLCVVPASPTNRAAAGSLALLLDGAIPVRDGQDVLAMLGLDAAGPGAGTAVTDPAGATTGRRRPSCLDDPVIAQVHALLGPTPTTPSGLAQLADLSIRAVLVAVSTLEDAGLARQGAAGVASGP